MVGSSHGIANARIADITSVVYHYKFLGRFREHTAWAAREENYWENSAEYKKYLEVLDKHPSLQMKQETAKELNDVNELLQNQFLVVSEDYISWVSTEEEGSVLRDQEGEPRELVEAFLKSRRQEWAKTLRIQRLEQGAP
jgi:hypothetical protein